MRLHPMTNDVLGAMRRLGRFMELPPQHLSAIIYAYEEELKQPVAPSVPDYQAHDAQALVPKGKPAETPSVPVTGSSKIAPGTPTGRFWREKGTDQWHGPFTNDDDAALDAHLSKAKHIDLEGLPLSTLATPALTHTTPTTGGA